MTCPCLPPAPARLRRRVQGRLQLPTRPPTRPRPTTRPTSSSTAIAAGQDHPRRHARVRRSRTTSTGVTKQIKFDDNGESGGRHGLGLQGRGRQDRPGQPDADQVSRYAHRTGDEASCGREHAPAAAAAPDACCSGTHRGLRRLLFDNFFSADRHRSRPGRDLRPGRPRLHARLRRAAADQLRPLRGLHVRDVRGAVGASCCSAARSGRAGSASARILRVCLLAAAMVMSGLIAVAARAGRLPAAASRRNAPQLIALISAIGASFVLAELMGLRDRCWRVRRPRRSC